MLLQGKKETVSRNEKIARSLSFHKAVMKIIKRSIEFLVQRSFLSEEETFRAASPPPPTEKHILKEFHNDEGEA